ncbi:MAG: c-type cytochrome [Armatimonadetes bacterium]|nr:c-type cytochrome [Anaerolineae bacterium]
MRKGIIIIAAIILIAGCQRDVGFVEKTVANGDVAAGRAAIIVHGCGACHTIPNVPNANAYVGPPLNAYQQRHYIAGNLPNNADNLIYWIQYPQSVEPGTAMPNLNVSETDARNIAAYLYSQ